MKNLLYLLVLTCFISISEVTALQDNNTDIVSLFGRLSSFEDLELTIHTDLTYLIENKYLDTYQEATITINHSSIKGIEWPARVKARGVYRKRICEFPPVKINFGSELSNHLGVEEIGALKVVTKCSDDLEALQLVQKEYLAYKLYNQLTDESFKAKMVTIHWKDTSGKMNPSSQLNFIIESKEELALRMGGKEVEQYSIHPDSLDMPSATISSLFQYMIGNLDWSINQMRNVTMIKIPTTKKVKIVPYDFDFCAMVNAPYATVPKALNLKFRGDRVYLGPEKSADLSEAKYLIGGQKKEIYKAIRRCPQLSMNNKAQVKKYISTFFDALEEPIKLPGNLPKSNGG